MSFLLMFGTYALGFWFGAKLVADGDMQAGDTLVVFFAIVVGGMGVGQGNSTTLHLPSTRH